MKQHTAVAISQRPTVPPDKPTSIFVAAKPDFSVEGLLRILSDNTENKVVACVEPSEACWEKLRNLLPEILHVAHSSIRQAKYTYRLRRELAVPGCR